MTQFNANAATQFKIGCWYGLPDKSNGLAIRTQKSTSGNELWQFFKRRSPVQPIYLPSEVSYTMKATCDACNSPVVAYCKSCGVMCSMHTSKCCTKIMVPMAATAFGVTPAVKIPQAAMFVPGQLVCRNGKSGYGIVREVYDRDGTPTCRIWMTDCKEEDVPVSEVSFFNASTCYVCASRKVEWVTTDPRRAWICDECVSKVDRSASVGRLRFEKGDPDLKKAGKKEYQVVCTCDSKDMLFNPAWKCRCFEGVKNAT